MKFVATNKVFITNFFSPFSFVAVFGSEIWDPGWVKIRIRDKHPRAATLGLPVELLSLKQAETLNSFFPQKGRRKIFKAISTHTESTDGILNVTF